MALVTDDFNSLNDFSPTGIHTVELSEASIAWATKVSNPVPEAQEQWQTFLRALAVAGFDQWLHEGALPFESHYSLLHAPRSGANISVGAYQLCILALGDPYQNTVTIQIDHLQTDNLPSDQRPAEETAHLYILAEVREEAGQVRVMSGLPCDRLLRLVQGGQLVTINETVQVPIAYFDVAPEKVLLQLSCLEPVASAATETVSVAQGDRRPSRPAGFINVGQWMQGQLDEMASQLSWALLPPMMPGSALRPVKSAVERLLDRLSEQGLHLPETARGVSGSVVIGSWTGQLYSWGWPVTTSEGGNSNLANWNLLVLLGPQETAELPEGIQLKVSDLTEILAMETLDRAVADYLFIQVQGAWEDRFWVQIILPDGQVRTLPAFGFD